MPKQILLTALFVISTIIQATAVTPTGWIFRDFSPKDYEVSVDKGAGQNGKDVPTIKSIKEPKNGRGFANLMQECRAEKYIGKRVRMSGYMKTDNVAGWAAFWFRVDQLGSTQFLSFDNMEERPIKGTTGWTKYNIVLDVPENAFDLAYGGMLIGKGQIWIDDITFEIVDNSVSTTGSFDKGSNPYILPAPVNLNFDSLDKLEQLFVTNPKQGWYKDGSQWNNYTIGIDKGAGQDGTNAGFVKSDNDKAKGFGSIAQNFKVNEYLGKRIRITVYVRSKDVKHRALLYAGVRNVGTKFLTYANTYKTPIKGTRDFTKCEVVLDLPANASYIIMGVQLFGGGEIWVDNFAIETVDNSVKTTTNWTDGKPTSMQVKPTNLDFSK